MAVQHLARSLHAKPWGRRDLPAAFGTAGEPVGEAWYQHPDGPLPLLVKWLFTSERLSIQVHPDDAMAQRLGHPNGKEEWWFVVAAAPGATLGLGTRQPLTGPELRAAALDGRLEQLMDWVPVAAGDWIHVPPGTVHAIGAGITLVEVQQHSDLTYRLFDYGRPRPLHLDLGVIASAARPYADPRRGHLAAPPPGAMMPLSHCQAFAISAGGAAAAGPLPAGPCWLVPIAGHISWGGITAGPGDVLHGRGGCISPRSDDALFLLATAPGRAAGPAGLQAP